MGGPKALGLPAKSEKLFDILPSITNLQEEIATNNAGIAGNLASIGSINEDITNHKSCQTSKGLSKYALAMLLYFQATNSHILGLLTFAVNYPL